MRDVVLTIIVFAGLPFIFRRPSFGVLMWCWLSYMNPHKLTYGFAQSFNYAEIVAIVTMVALLIDPERKRVPLTVLTMTWLMFVVWMCITTANAFVPETSVIQLVKVLKIQLTTFFIILVFTTKERLIQLISVIAGSIAFFGIKGGLFTLMSGGSGRVWGPEGSFIQDNNSLAVALLTTLPLMHFLRTQTRNQWLRYGILGAMILTGLAALGSYSRGALFSGAAMLAFFWLKSKKKFVTAIAMVLVVPALLAFMPEKWNERVDTIFESKAVGDTWSEVTGFPPPIESRDKLHFWPTDQSAIGRVNAWNYSINVANANLTGGGFESWEPYNFALYAPILEDVHAAHSIYFGVLADHGWIGLVLFVSIGFMAWRTANWTIRTADGLEDMAYLADLNRMVQVALVAFASGGAFLSLAYFDLCWGLVAIVVVSRTMLETHLEGHKNAANSAPRTFMRRQLSLTQGHEA